MPLLKFSNSNTPAGPFHTITFALLIGSISNQYNQYQYNEYNHTYMDKHLYYIYVRYIFYFSLMFFKILYTYIENSNYYMNNVKKQSPANKSLDFGPISKPIHPSGIPFSISAAPTVASSANLSAVTKSTGK